VSVSRITSALIAARALFPGRHTPFFAPANQPVRAVSSDHMSENNPAFMEKTMVF
jgi:hypothetical protein